MARFTFPTAQQAVDIYSGGNASTILILTTDAAGRVLADVQTLAGATLAGSALALNANGSIPQFLGPDTVQTVYSHIQGDTPSNTAMLTAVQSAPTSAGNAESVINTVRVNAGFVAVGQTIKNYVGKVALSASVPTTVTLETVTTGKTYIITDIYLSHDSATVLDCRIQAAGADIFRAPVKGDTAPVQMAGMESQPNAASGQIVTILYPVATGAPSAFFNIFGFEQ